jgi:hypothetical protein
MSISRQPSRVLFIAVVVFLAAVRPSAAQSPYDEGYRGAFGLWAGGVIPIEKALENGLQGAISLEGAASSHVAFRLQAGFGRPGVDHAFRHDVRRLFGEIDAIYNWDAGAAHPYVGIGAGLYRYASVISGSAADDPVLRADLIALGLDPDSAAGTREHEIEIGANGIAGVEYFLAPSASVSVEGGYHRVGRVFDVQPFDGSFLSASVALKLYF